MLEKNNPYLIEIKEKEENRYQKHQTQMVDINKYAKNKEKEFIENDKIF
jgi:hypothetical protein